MKRYFIAALILLGLGVFSWAQGSKDLFDAKKSDAELEIMKGILGTTISHVGEVRQKSPWVLNAYNMNAYYLVGQGATFVIPTSALRRSDLTPFANVKLALDLSKVKEQTQLIAAEAQRQVAEIKWANQVFKNYGGGQGPGAGEGAGSGKGSGVGSGAGSEKGPGAAVPPAPPAPPAQPAPPAPPAPPHPPQIDLRKLEDIQATLNERQIDLKKLEDFQTTMKKSREEAAANQQKFLESLKELRTPLIEALANYGDSLTQVKPGEYINLILTTEDSLDLMDSGPAKTRHDIISAQKSWITDYKAGRITLDNFKQKVLQYTE